MEQNHCGQLGFSINTILACFDPEVILLLKSRFWLKSNLRFEKRYRKLIFKMAAVMGILDFLSAHLAILFLISALMLIIKF